jgi:hypothetical protein
MPAAIGGIVLSIAGGGLLWLHEHDGKLQAQIAADQAVVAAKAQAEQDQRTIAGLSLTAQKAAALAATMTKLKEAINAAPKSKTCATSPAVVALYAGLRSGAIGGHTGAAGAAAGVNVALPGSAPAARR